MAKPAFIRTLLKKQEKERAKIAARKKQDNLSKAGYIFPKKDKPVPYHMNDAGEVVPMTTKKTPKKSKAKEPKEPKVLMATKDSHTSSPESFLNEIHQELNKAEKYNPFKKQYRKLIPIDQAMK